MSKSDTYKKNDLLEVTITDMNDDGDGIGKADGYTLFVKGGVIGDELIARVLKPKKSYAYAKKEKVITPSPFRTLPPCPLAGPCGGCQLQEMTYEKQLAFKYDKVRGNLLRIGGFDEELIDSVMEPIVGMDDPWRYRGKAQYPIGMGKDGKPIAGFYAGHTHSIQACKDCLLGKEENGKILSAILSFMEEFHILPYDEETGKGYLRHVLIRTSRENGSILVCLIVNDDKLPKSDVLVKRLLEAEPKVTSVSLNTNKENTNVIMGPNTKTLYGDGYITDSIRIYNDSLTAFTGKAISYQISPKSFYQVNPLQTEKLYSLALSYAGLSGSESVWDLYCGIGTISLFLAGSAGKVFGVEIVPEAIEDARENALRNGISNAEFFVGKAEEVLPAYYRSHKGEDMAKPDVIVVDPPRKGCDEACLNTMLEMAPSRIVYVSCDSATLARDLRILTDGGYTLERVRPVDQFPHTVHVETVCLLSRKAPV